MRSRPHRPEKCARKQQHRDDLRIDAGLGEVGLGKALQIRHVLLPERVVGGSPRAQKLEKPYPPDFRVFHCKLSEVLRRRRDVDRLHGHRARNLRVAKYRPIQLVADPGRRGFDQLLPGLKVLISGTAIDARALRDLGNADAFLTVLGQLLSSSLENRLARALWIPLAPGAPRPSQSRSPALTSRNSHTI